MSFFVRLWICFFISVSALSAKVEKHAAIVIDYTNGRKVLFAENADAARYPASITKVMTVYLLFEAIKNKKITFQTKFKVSKLAANQIPSKLGLKVGDKISVLDIVKALMVKSANDVAVVAAEGLAGSVDKFCKLMNAKAKKLGMKHTSFVNPSGVPDKKQISSARDLVTLGMALFRDFPQHRHLLALKSFKYGKNTHNTHCKIVHWYKGVDAAKTGYINASGFNLFVTATKYNKQGKERRLFVVVMGEKSSKGRDLYAAQLMNKYFNDYQVSKQSTGNKLAKNSLLAQINKSEVLDQIIQEDEAVFISKTTPKMNELLDKLYQDELCDDVCEDEAILIPSTKKK